MTDFSEKLAHLMEVRPTDGDQPHHVKPMDGRPRDEKPLTHRHAQQRSHHLSARWRLDPTHALIIILVLACLLGISFSMLLIASRNIAIASSYSENSDEVRSLLDSLSSDTSEQTQSQSQSATSPQQTSPSQTAQAPPTQVSPVDMRVDLNTATSEQLETIKGIGPVTAQKILDYRAAHGLFTSVDDLLNVSGIGPKTLEKIAPGLRVGSG